MKSFNYKEQNLISEEDFYDFLNDLPEVVIRYKDDKISNSVNDFALALTLFSGLNDSYDYFAKFLDADSAPGTHALIVISIIIAVGMIAWRIVDGVQKKYTNLNKEKLNNNRH